MDDCGRVIHPLLAAGQVHGGVAQGLGQALLENVVYTDDGQLLTGSLMDYGMPRAALALNAVTEMADPEGIGNRLKQLIATPMS